MTDLEGIVEGPTSKPARTAWLISLALATVTVAVYLETLSHSFVNYDDPAYVTGNGQVKSGLSWMNIVWAFKTRFAANWIPLTWLSHMLDCQIYGTNAAGHHLSSLLIHLASTLVLFFTLQTLTAALWRSAFVAALFAVHPLNVESVAWVAERKNVLCTLFFFLALFAYAGYARRPDLKRYLTVVVLFALGLMSKSMVITLPFVLLLLDYWPLGRLAIGRDPATTAPEPNDHRAETAGSPQPVKLSRLVVEKVPLLGVAAADGFVTFLMQLKAKSVGTLGAYPLAVRIENAIVSYAAYLQKTLWPAKLAPFYPHSKSYLPAWQVGLAAAVLVTITVAVVWATRRMKYLGVGWLWFIGTLVPVIGLVQIGAQSMADRYAYIPLVGIFILLVWGVSELIERYRRARDYVIIVGVCALLGLIIVTRVQLGYWADSLTLWDHARHVTEDNDIAYNNLGEAIAMRGDLAEAAPFFFKALEINPELVTAQENVGTVLIQRGQIDEAIAHYKRAIDLDSTAFGAYNKLGSALGSKGQLDESIRCLEMALKINPGYAPAMANLGVALVNRGKLDQASVWFERALQFTTDKDMATQCHFMYGNLLMEQGEPARAAAEYKAALSLEPDFSAAAEALSKTGRTGN